MRLRDVMLNTSISNKYSTEINSTQSLEDLRRVLDDWKEFAPHAIEQSQYWEKEEFQKFREIVSIITMGMIYPGSTDWCSEVLLPSAIHFIVLYSRKHALSQDRALSDAMKESFLVLDGGALRLTQRGTLYAAHFLGATTTQL